jgi:hypothetical protein
MHPIVTTEHSRFADALRIIAEATEAGLNSWAHIEYTHPAKVELRVEVVDPIVLREVMKALSPSLPKG